MKKILITGANSYIGTSFEKYLNTNFSNGYLIDTVDLMDKDWKNKSFAGYDSVFHVAGIAHSDSGKISVEREKLYYAVNTELTAEVADKAKRDGALQFVFMSSAIVYGDSAPIGKTMEITADTPVNPANCYGDSKVQAENSIVPLNDDGFRVVIIRSPMVYGKGSKGNYGLLSKLAKKTPLFPKVNNKRSMIYIENLCEFVRLMIENCEQGVFWPQNAEYSNTSELVRLIAAVRGKRLRLVRGFTWLLRLMGCFSKLPHKAFGSLTYSREISEYKSDYVVCDLKTSIERTEAD